MYFFTIPIGGHPPFVVIMDRFMSCVRITCGMSVDTANSVPKYAGHKSLG